MNMPSYLVGRAAFDVAKKTAKKAALEARRAEFGPLMELNHSLNSATLVGVTGQSVEVQARAVEVFDEPKPWEKALCITGAPSAIAAQIAKRIAGALTKRGAPMVDVRIIVNLSPADVPKKLATLDLPIAITALQAGGFIPPLPESVKGDFVLFGEIDIHGQVCRVPGALAMAMTAANGQHVIVPAGNEKESVLATIKPEYDRCTVHPVYDIGEVIEFFRGKSELDDARKGGSIQYAEHAPDVIDFGAIKGNQHVKRAATIAAAGGHNFLMIGPPGCLAGDVPIHDPVDGTTLTVKERFDRGEQFHVEAWDESTGETVTAIAMPPVEYEPETILEFYLSNGERIRVTPQHRFWNGGRWILAAELFEMLQIFGVYHLPKNSSAFLSTHSEDALHCSRKAEGSRFDCRLSRHSCDAQPHWAGGHGQSLQTSPFDAEAHNRCDEHLDGMAIEQERSHQYHALFHQPTPDCDGLLNSSHSCEVRHRKIQDYASVCACHNLSISQSRGAEGSSHTTLSQHEDSRTKEYDEELHCVECFCPSFGFQSEAVLTCIQNDRLYPALSCRNQKVQLPCESGVQSTYCESQSHCDETSPLLVGDSHPQDVLQQQLHAPASTIPSPFSRGLDRESTLFAACDKPCLRVIGVRECQPEVYYDFHVPIYNTYIACGVINHNCGKSMLAKALAGILPRLDNADKVDLTRIYSAASKLQHDGTAVTRRPVRICHPTISPTGMVGGGHKGLPQPGEATLAHLGVLFLDEFPEFTRPTLEALRQPCEDGMIRIARTEFKAEFPARFTLVAAMNPCPCGYYGLEDGKCTCTPDAVSNYQKKISGPMMDRIDMKVPLLPLTVDEMLADAPDEPESPQIRAVVERTREIQRQRFAGTDIPFNAAIPGGKVGKYCQFRDVEAFREILECLDLSARSMDRLRKVARTIADLAESELIEQEHVEEAAQLACG